MREGGEVLGWAMVWCTVHRCGCYVLLLCVKVWGISLQYVGCVFGAWVCVRVLGL
jgi:hypothetical protein